MPTNHRVLVRTARDARPKRSQSKREIHPFGHITSLPIALSRFACEQSVENLNQLLADTLNLRDLYKKAHWQISGPTFIALHELLDAHYEQQAGIADTLAERVQMLGGVSLAIAHDVAETTILPRAPKGAENVPDTLSRLLTAHEFVLKEARTMARQAVESGDDGTNDTIVGDVIRAHEKQVWFLAQHLVNSPLLAK